MRDMLTISLTVTITADPATWYREHGEDTQVSLPGYVLASLRELPRIQAARADVRLARLTRRGRGAAQHRSPVPGPFLLDPASITAHRTPRHRLERKNKSSLFRAFPRIARTAISLANNTGDQMPRNPSGKFLQTA
ncbi:hypothetical protein [Saccharopolyspora hattusasensis]|uniref:hypothetical protein n=1 Tax=Saccharopolyspora hattusasensis TaxID=1128679 RepID=UPI003D98F4FE